MNDRSLPVKAVFFDAADTLLALPEAPVVLRDYLASRAFYRTPRACMLALDDALRRFYYSCGGASAGRCSPESDRGYWLFLYRQVLERLGAAGRWPEDELLRICRELYDIFTGPRHYRLFDDVEETLERLQRRGLRLGIVSNFAPTLESVLKKLGIAHYFRPIVVSTLIGVEKPNPEIFRRALRLAGLTGAEALHIGDHETNDIWASAQAGIRAVRIKRYAYMTGAGMLSLRELFEPPYVRLIQEDGQ